MREEALHPRHPPIAKTVGNQHEDWVEPFAHLESEERSISNFQLLEDLWAQSMLIK